MKVLTIQRSRWRRGGDTSALMKDYGMTLLLNSRSEKMCCLGFDALAYGFSSDDIKELADPQELMQSLDDTGRDTEFYDYFAARTSGPENSEVVCEAMTINDDSEITDAEREAKLIPILKQIGGYDEVCFVD